MVTNINKHFAKGTTLLLLACKIKSWGVVKTILKLNPEKYASLFKTPGAQQKHPLYHQDDSKSSCLLLALEDGQLDICEKIVDIVDVYTLRCIHIVEDKNISTYVEDKIKNGDEELKDLRKRINEKLGKNCDKKKIKKKTQNNISCDFEGCYLKFPDEKIPHSTFYSGPKSDGFSSTIWITRLTPMIS